MSRPTHETSNYGWALWHLEQMEAPGPGPEIGLLHAAAAQARATLALADEMQANRGEPINYAGSTWSGRVSDE